MKRYKVVVHEVNDETNEEKELLNDEYEGLALYGDLGESFHEVLMHVNIMGLAAMFVSGSKSKVAVKLANVIDLARKSVFEDLEDELAELIGGNDNERV